MVVVVHDSVSKASRCRSLNAHFAESASWSSMGVMPPAWLNHRVLTVLDTPTALAAASVCSPAAITTAKTLS